MTTHPLVRMARWRLLAAMIGVVVLLVGGVVVAVGAGAAVPGPPAGWSVVFVDDFTGPAGSGVNTANWQYTTGTSYPGGPANFGTGEVETMTASTANVSLDGGGNLRITPQRDGAGRWTSGRVETRRSDFQPPVGGRLRVEARIQQPAVTGAGALGYWPAFWMLGAPYRGNWWNWPGVGEMDIMENVNGRDRNHATLHCGTSPGGECGEKVGIGNNIACPGSSCTGNFHTYALEWDRSVSPQQLRFSVDGMVFHTVAQNRVSPGVWDAATNHGFFIILNVAMGGEFPAAFGGGPTGSTIAGRPMVVDYVAVWSSGGGGPPPPPPPPPPTCGPLISAGRPATASSIEAANLGPQFAVDNNPGTRWSSAFSDPQWIQVDLGSSRPISRVRLNWEAAYATAYSIQTSATGTSWTTSYATSTGDGGIDDLAISTTTRYLRMNGTQRGTPYGYSLWELEIYGACGSTPPPPPPTASPTTQPPPGSTTWQPNTYYPIGARVSYAGLNYQCRQAHTSIVTWEPPNTPALWLQI
jgi:beta-glucanase (GH16 family)